MNPFLLFMLKAGLALAVLFSVYFLFLSRDTTYVRNRFYILTSLLASFILPFISIQTRTPHEMQLFGRELTEILVSGTAEMSSTVVSPASVFSWQQAVLTVYLAGLVAAGLKFLLEILSLTFLIVKHRKRDGRIITVRNTKSSGFSAFGYIFINSSLDPYEAQEIIKHEQKHLERFHFFDIVIIEFMKVFQWFNPFIYMFDRSLREVHEFEADEKCLSSGIPVHSYQGLVMNQVFRTKVFSVSNSFSNPTLIKKRMIMMTKKRSGWMANFKILLALPVVAVLLIVFSTCSEKITYNDVLVEEVTPPSKAPLISDAEPEPFVVVEEMPMYTGGDSALLRHIAMNTTYPEAAKKAGTQGRVIVRFCITSAGTVDKISVLKGVSPELDEEAVRVVSTLGIFEPGRQAGKPVPVWYMVPITFTLSGNKSAESAAAVPPPPPPGMPPSSPGASESIIATKDGDDGKTYDAYVVVEEMPVFPGGNEALLQFIAENTSYPEQAKKNNITGRVIVRFAIAETGKVGNISVLHGVDPDLDAEAIRVCSMLPDFIPGKQGGKAVAVWYMVPITFSLK
ncbi:MAG: TonB family protein [Bacteroidales bacterium]|nr:TonB family protein [Bacteroidales bacterium]MBN2633663.1 TonB family protein [Bacteroidales bacterium]